MSQYKVMVTMQWSGIIHEFLVTNQPDGYDRGAKWPCVATFPVRPGYSEDDQRRRAVEYRDYMNRTIPIQPPIGS